MRGRILLVPMMFAFACTTAGTDTTPSTAAPDPTITSPSTTTTRIDAPGSSTSTTELTTTTTTEPDGTRLTITYEAGTVAGGGRLEVPLGDDVVIAINSDVTDEVHLHGYDIFLDLEAGVPAELAFTADIPGIFELELESSHVDLAQLEIAP